MGKHEAAKTAKPGKPAGFREVFFADGRPTKKLILPIVGVVAAVLVILLVVYINTPPSIVDRPPPTETPATSNHSGGTMGQTTTAPNTTTLPAQTEPPPLVRKEKFYTFLLIGTHDNYNTDTIMLASIDLNGQTPKATFISIPRDSQVDVSWDIKRINSVYGVNGGGEKGANALRDEIEEICGVYPDFYAIVNINSFTKIVDKVGGVPFYVPYDMEYTSADELYSVNLKKGQQTLNSADALSMVRYRGTGKSDWGRTELQRDFLVALMKRVKSTFSLDKIPGFIDIAFSSIKTNMPAKDMLWFYNNAVDKMDLNEDIDMYSMPDAGTGKYKSGSYGNQDYVYLDKQGIVELVNRTVNPYTTDITPEMLNVIRLENK